MILVTGSTGHLGNVLIRNLLAENKQNIRVLVLPQDDCVSLSGLNVDNFEGNVLDYPSVERAMKDIEVVYHLAGVISIIPGAETAMHQVNIEGTRNVARAALTAGVKRMVHTSSVHALFREPHGIVMNESTPLCLDNPAGAYDYTKAAGTSVVLDYIKEGLDAVIACPTGIIGPYDYMGSEMGNTIMAIPFKQ